MSEQKVAVVTGGSAGIGAATCRALAKDGWKVVVAARRLEKCQSIADEIGGVAMELDVVDWGSVEKLAEIDRVDLLVNNAGGAKELDFLRDADDADWEWMFQTNVMGTMRVTRADPGRVKTDFSLNRFKGDKERANKVYEGKQNLTADDIAEAVRWVASLPTHVNIDTMSIMPVDQAER